MTTLSPTGTTSVNDKLIGYIRTYVPYGVGAVLVWLLSHAGLDLRGPVQVALVAFSVAVVTNVYYLIVRLFEQRFPSFGVLLGFPSEPKYTAVDNLWASLVRTAIPTLVGAVIVSVVSIWVQVSAAQQAWLITTATAVATSLYYTVAREITAKWPATKVLLGTSIPATYVATTGTAASPSTVTPSTPATVVTPAPTATVASSTAPVASDGTAPVEVAPTASTGVPDTANPTVGPETPEQAAATATLDPSDPSAS